MANETNTSPPTIIGTRSVGATITATSGTWSPTPGSFTYVWERADDAAGTNLARITSATGSTYTIDPADVNKFLRVGVYPATDPVYSGNRWVYSIGSPTFDTDGWVGNVTQNQWGRQGFAPTLASRVDFADSVTVMQSVTDSNGQVCHTMKGEIQPTDPDANGGTTNQRAQIISPPAGRAWPSGWPSLGIVQGQTWWYGLAVTTNAGYVPHYDATFGNFNNLFDFHNTTNTPTGSVINIAVCTIGPADDSTYWVTPNPTMKQLTTPHLGLQLNAGNKNSVIYPNDSGPTGDMTLRRWQGPVFTAGHLYRMQWRVKWGTNWDGELEWWVDGTQVFSATGINTMWYTDTPTAWDQGMYFNLANYRAYDTSLPTNIVYWGGVIKGSTRADVTVP